MTQMKACLGEVSTALDSELRRANSPPVETGSDHPRGNDKGVQAGISLISVVNLPSPYLKESAIQKDTWLGQTPTLSRRKSVLTKLKYPHVFSSSRVGKRSLEVRNISAVVRPSGWSVSSRLRMLLAFISVDQSSLSRSGSPDVSEDVWCEKRWGSPEIYDGVYKPRWLISSTVHAGIRAMTTGTHVHGPSNVLSRYHRG